MNVKLAECIEEKNIVVRGDCVDTKCLDGEICRKMIVNGGC